MPSLCRLMSLIISFSLFLRVTEATERCITHEDGIVKCSSALPFAARFGIGITLLTIAILLFFGIWITCQRCQQREKLSHAPGQSDELDINSIESGQHLQRRKSYASEHRNQKRTRSQKLCSKLLAKLWVRQRTSSSQNISMDTLQSEPRDDPPPYAVRPQNEAGST